MHIGRGGSRYLYFLRWGDFGGSGEEALTGCLGGNDGTLGWGRVGAVGEWFPGFVFRVALCWIGGVRFSQICVGGWGIGSIVEADPDL